MNVLNPGGRLCVLEVYHCVLNSDPFALLLLRAMASVVIWPGMIDQHAAEIEQALERIKSQAASGTFRVTQHGQQEMVEEEIRLDEVLQAIGR